MVGSQQRRQETGGLKDKREESHEKEYQRLLNKFEMESFMAQKRIVEPCWSKDLEERGALPKEEGDASREYKAIHEENFLSSWLREDGREKEERMVEVSNENEEERSEKEEKRRRERRELETLKIYSPG